MQSGGSLKWPHLESHKGITWELKPKDRCCSSTASMHGSTVTQLTAQKHDQADGRCSVHRVGSAVVTWEATAIRKGRNVRSLGVLAPWGRRSVGRFALAELPDSGAELCNSCFEHISLQLKKSPWMRGSFLCLREYPVYGCFCVGKGLYSERLRQWKQKSGYWKPHPLITLHHSQLPSIAFYSHAWWCVLVVLTLHIVLTLFWKKKFFLSLSHYWKTGK